MSYQPPQQQVIYQQVVKQPGNGMAVTSLVLGIVAIVIGVWTVIPFLGIGAAITSFVPALLAVVFGHLGKRAVQQVGKGHGQAMTGLVLGYITLGIIVITTFVWIVAFIGSAASSSMS